MDLNNSEEALKKRKKAIHDLYTPFSNVEKELEARSQNKDLIREINLFLGKNKPTFLEDGVVNGYLSRPIATPNIESEYFFDLCKDIKLSSIILECPDKFVAKNPEKYHLCKMYLYYKSLNHNTYQTKSEIIIDFHKFEGKDLDEITTTWDENLIDFHHRMFLKQNPEFTPRFINFKNWFNHTRHLDIEYYTYFLSLFLVHGVLFENYWPEDEEDAMFIDEKLLPSIERIKTLFGLKPLIVPLLPLEVQKHKHWLSYPLSISNSIPKDYNTFQLTDHNNV